MINTDDEPRYHPDHIDDNRNSNPGAAAAPGWHANCF